MPKYSEGWAVGPVALSRTVVLVPPDDDASPEVSDAGSTVAYPRAGAGGGQVQDWPASGWGPRPRPARVTGAARTITNVVNTAPRGPRLHGGRLA